MRTSEEAAQHLVNVMLEHHLKLSGFGAGIALALYTLGDDAAADAILGISKKSEAEQVADVMRMKRAEAQVAQGEEA